MLTTCAPKHPHQSRALVPEILHDYLELKKQQLFSTCLSIYGQLSEILFVSIEMRSNSCLSFFHYYHYAQFFWFQHVLVRITQRTKEKQFKIKSFSLSMFFL